ncbi:MAG: putative DNA-binding domain-containing protein [Halioglobus sp.]
MTQGESVLRNSQMNMARFLRNPEAEAPPEGVETRRLQVYLDLVYNNIEGFIRGGFPVLHSLYEEEDWHGLVRQFIDVHRCHTPYFLEISQEFLRFLMEDFAPRECDPPFIAELAHYEWVELALDVSEDSFPISVPMTDSASTVVALSPLAWVLGYKWPVHEIGPGFRPQVPGEPCYLVVYRDASDAVQFMATNAATARLLELVRESSRTIEDVVILLAKELNVPAKNLRGFIEQQLNQLCEQGVVYYEAV